MARSLVFVLMLSALYSCLASQESRNQSCDLMVRIRTTNERIIETPVRVELLGSQGPLATANLVGDGSANFQVTSGKSYRLQVSGTGFQTVTTGYFAIQPLESEHTETIHLKSDTLPGTQAPSGQATISVSELNIPQDAAAELKKGLDAYSRGEMDRAANYFEKATAKYPKFARAYDLQGAIAIKDNNRSRARALFSKSIDVDSTYLPGYLDLARMDLQDHLYTQSESLLAKAISLNPFQPEPVALLATTEFMNKEYDKALADVQRTHALPNHEKFAEVHLMAANVLRMQNRRAEATQQLQFFLKEKPDSPQAARARRDLASLQSTQ